MKSQCARGKTARIPSAGVYKRSNTRNTVRATEHAGPWPCRSLPTPSETADARSRRPRQWPCRSMCRTSSSTRQARAGRPKPRQDLRDRIVPLGISRTASRLKTSVTLALSIEGCLPHIHERKTPQIQGLSRCSFKNILNSSSLSSLIFVPHSRRMDTFRRIYRVFGHTKRRVVADLQEKLRAVTERSNLLDEACGIGLWEAVLHNGDPTHEQSRWTWSAEFRRMLGHDNERDFPNVFKSWAI